MFKFYTINPEFHINLKCPDRSYFFINILSGITSYLDEAFISILRISNKNNIKFKENKATSL